MCHELSGRQLDEKMDKSANIFRFKRFCVVNERSAMKVNTDGVLLGVAMTIKPSDRRFLDIGTGTGTIALIAAQRVEGFLDFARNDSPCNPVSWEKLCIHAIDIDAISAEEAALNFSNSPWAGHLQAHAASLDEYAESLDEGETFDLIFSNPPHRQRR